MKKIYFFLSLTILSLTGLYAQGNKIEFVEYTLPNGLQVILHQDKSVPKVAVSVMYHVGSKNENPDRTGFAHFFEHLLFEGSENLKRGDFDRYVQNAGGTLNANTWYDRTFYYEELPSNQLATGLWLESERMLHAKVEKEGIETQRQVVKEERRQRVENQPYGSLIEEVMKRAFTVHPYKWPVIGSMAHLDAAKDEDFINFYKMFYVPNNAILSVAGNFEIDEAKKMIQMYFGEIPKGTAKVFRPEVTEPPLKGEIRDTVYDNVQLPAVVYTYRTPKQGTPDYYAVNMLSQLLSQGQSSRLYKSLVDDQEKCLFVGNFPMAMEDAGVSIAFGIANSGVDPMEVEKGMDAVIENAAAGLMDDMEFQKLKNQVENDIVTNNETILGRAENLANYKMYFGDANLINAEIDRYLKVTREDIQRVAKMYFNKNNRVVIYYLPKAAQP